MEKPVPSLPVSLRAQPWGYIELAASAVIVGFGQPTRLLAGDGRPAEPPAASGAALVRAFQDAFAGTADRMEPAVVTIIAGGAPADGGERRMLGQMEEELPEGFPFRKRGFSRDAPPPRTSSGSGVIVRQVGSTVYVLTNNHVVSRANRFRVRLFDRSEHAGELVGSDERSDLAVLRFQARRPLPAGSVARFGDSDRTRVGEWAIAIGSPLEYDSTLTVGVISARGRTLDGARRGGPVLSDLLQTDAAINPGNSGGPLLNIDGEVIGINVAIASPGPSAGNIGIGFAIPANLARTVSDRLIAEGRVSRSYVGILCRGENQELGPELRETLGAPQGGALAEEVAPDSPAQRAGVRPGDVIVRFDGRDVRSFTALEQVAAFARAGQPVPVEILRGGRSVQLTLTPAVRPDEGGSVGPPADPKAPLDGEDPRGAVRELGLALEPAPDGSGLVITHLLRGGRAVEAGLSSGDVIEQVGRTPVNSVEEFRRIVAEVKPGQSLVLGIRTAMGLRFVLLRR